MKYSFSDKNQKLAIIGCGYWGTIIAKTLISLKFKKIYIYDKNRRNANLLKKKFPILKIEKKLTSILKDKTLINCFLITPTSKNYDLLKRFIINKKNIFIEKTCATKSKTNKIYKKTFI